MFQLETVKFEDDITVVLNILQGQACKNVLYVFIISYMIYLTAK